MNNNHYYYYCEKCFDLIESFIEGELDTRTAEQINLHVFACPKCLAEYEMQRREKEIYAQYLFDAEPPPGSWTNLQARLDAENGKATGETVIPVSLSPRRNYRFVFGFSPALTAAVLLFIGVIGFVWLKNAPFEKNIDRDVAENQSGYSQASPQSSEFERNSASDSQTKTVDSANNAAPNDDEPSVGNQSFKATDNSRIGKKQFVAETVKIERKTIFSSAERKPASEKRLNENQPQASRMKNLEAEIAGQIEKVELLLRSFRNVRAKNESVEGFDVEYEKLQARKLLSKNAELRRDAETYGISYAEELLSRVEPYLLEIANLETNPATDKVLDIKERVSSQNIIASLQVYR
jgi:hypothetical protein